MSECCHGSDNHWHGKLAKTRSTSSNPPLQLVLRRIELGEKKNIHFNIRSSHSLQSALHFLSKNQDGVIEVSAPMNVQGKFTVDGLSGDVVSTLDALEVNFESR